MFVVDIAMRELLYYDNYCWIIGTEIAKMWEERLCGESLNYANNNEVQHQYLDFLCCKLEGKELACKEPRLYESAPRASIWWLRMRIWETTKRKFEDLFDFHITLKDEIAYELNLSEERVNWVGSNRTYKNCNGKHSSL